MIKKIFYTLLILLASLAAVVAYRTMTAKSKQLPDSEVVATPALPQNAVEHLQNAIRCRTISFGDTTLWRVAPFDSLRQLLESAYPMVHQRLSREIFSGHSYLYKWEGKNTALRPYIFMAHQDVVPVEENTLHLWAAPPFSADIKNGNIYGRGAIDNKCNLISIFEAAERLLQQGFQPERTLYFIFGQDEEIGGRKGAIPIANALEARGIKADLLIDEGGLITKEKLPELSKAVALVATAEKGYLSLDFSVQKKGGHSSMPETETAVDILMQGLNRLHDNPFPPRFEKATESFLDYIGPEMPTLNKMAFTNRWLLKSLIIKKLDERAASRAMLRTTAVTTIINAGVKDNVIPTIATATANFRLLPGDSANYVIRRVKEIINDDRVEVKIKSAFTEGSSAAVADGMGFQKINQIIKQTYSDVIVTPFLLIGATDSRHFLKVSDNIVKFSPVVDPIGFHTYDEQVSINNFQRSIWFFEQLMKN
jgi:carboxypeptidase PM20D1